MTPVPVRPRPDGVRMGCNGGRAGFGPAAFDSADLDASVPRAMAILAVPLCRCDQRTIESGKEPFERLVAPARAALAASACRCDQRTIDETPVSSTGRAGGSVRALSARTDSSWLAGFVLSGDGCSFSVDTSERSQPGPGDHRPGQGGVPR
jgi:hypothetical protein